MGLNMSLASVLPYIQISLAVILMAGVLVQQSEAGLGSGFGGDGFSNAHHTKRGSEKFIFVLTIVIAILFASSCLAALFI